MRRAGWDWSSRFACVALLCLLCAAAPCSAAAQAGDARMVLGQADFLDSEASAPPDDAAAWHPVTLPDNWNLSRAGKGGFGWYRLRFRLAQQPEALEALYIAKLSMNAAFYVNGAFIGSGGSFAEPVSRHWNRAQFFGVPPALLKAGDNVLHVRLYGYPNSRAGLGQIEVGPAQALRPVYERRYFVQTLLPQLCNIVVAALGLFTFALWVRRRTEATYVLFFVFTVLWAVRSTHMVVRDIPLPAFYWDIWVQSSFGWCALLFVALAMRYTGLRWRRFEALLLAYAVSGPLIMYLAGPQRLHVVASNWSFVIVPVAIFFEGFLIRDALRKRTPASVLLAAVWALIIAASVHDGLVHRDRLEFESFYLVSYVMILLSVVMGWILTNRFVQALSVAEKLNLELEQRVEEKHAELAENFQVLKRMDRARAVAQERERLMREMHDGLGAQLMATLDMVEQPDSDRAEIAETVRECLDGVRIAIHSLEPIDDDLLTVLGGLRYRFEARLRKRGIALSWEVRDLPPLPWLTPPNVLHILRILQEAFTNIAKHADAKTIAVRTGYDASHVFIELADDGCGFKVGREGRGIGNMRRRAQALGGRLEIRPAERGTVLRLEIPRAPEQEVAAIAAR